MISSDFTELITANIYSLKKGMNKANLVNYYSETGDIIEIPLMKTKARRKTPNYITKKYNKAKTAFSYAEKEIKKIKAEISYLESVMFAIEAAQNLSRLTRYAWNYMSRDI